MSALGWSLAVLLLSLQQHMPIYPFLHFCQKVGICNCDRANIIAGI